MKRWGENVRVIIISEMSGSGYEGYVGRAQTMLRHCGVAVICLDTNLFLGARMLHLQALR